MNLEQHTVVEEQFRTMADTAPMFIWVANTDKGCYFFNKGWLDFTGENLESQHGDGWIRSFHQDDQQRCLEIYATNFDQRTPFKMEYRLRHHDGQYRWILNDAVPRYAANGDFVGFIGSGMDISELKEAEKTAEEFMDIAGHELKTPLTTLLVSAQMLEKLYDSDLQSHYIPNLLATMRASVKKLDLLINDFLNVSVAKEKRFVLEKSSFIFNDLIQECYEYFKLSSDKEFVVNGNKSCKVFADRKKVEQVLMNLLNNAVRYAPSSQQLAITIEETEQLVTISVTDYGLNISGEVLPKLFDRYFRGAPNGSTRTSGMGLGLYVSKGIIEAHGGDMNVRSNDGGTIFRFSLPSEGSS